MALPGFVRSRDPVRRGAVEGRKAGWADAALERIEQSGRGQTRGYPLRDPGALREGIAVKSTSQMPSPLASHSIRPSAVSVVGDSPIRVGRSSAAISTGRSC